MAEVVKYKQLEKRTNDFAHRCVKLAVALEGTKLGNHISGQLIRCSTSAAANYRACNLAQSRAAFAAKLSIVLEETDEAIFWMEFSSEEKLVSKIKIKSLLEEANELKAIFFAARKTLSSKKKR
ncbi:MAG: four helix bundle protein [Planctomycetes bacterium HGW-Planctomycetes-1]|nr:MAG: four helix bundle protein [Planctomycetes bacterium HGW-Planctomycetes-1]